MLFHADADCREPHFVKAVEQQHTASAYHQMQHGLCETALADGGVKVIVDHGFERGGVWEVAQIDAQDGGCVGVTLACFGQLVGEAFGERGFASAVVAKQHPKPRARAIGPAAARGNQWHVHALAVAAGILVNVVFGEFTRFKIFAQPRQIGAEVKQTPLKLSRREAENTFVFCRFERTGGERLRDDHAAGAVGGFGFGIVEPTSEFVDVVLDGAGVFAFNEQTILAQTFALSGNKINAIGVNQCFRLHVVAQQAQQMGDTRFEGFAFLLRRATAVATVFVAALWRFILVRVERFGIRRAQSTLALGKAGVKNVLNVASDGSIGETHGVRGLRKREQ